jgi:hypothetical protein
MVHPSACKRFGIFLYQTPKKEIDLISFWPQASAGRAAPPNIEARVRGHVADGRSKWFSCGLPARYPMGPIGGSGENPRS